MLIEYDAERDLLYLYFSSPDTKVVTTKTIAPGIFIDLDKDDKLIGLEIIDASGIVKDLFEFKLHKISTKTK